MIRNSLGILLIALGLLSACVTHDTINPKTQLKADLKAIQDFLAVYDPNAQPTAEGVYYTIDTVGLGIYPVVSDSVQFEYSIRDIQNLIVQLDTTRLLANNTTPFKILSSLIAGLQIGLPRFPVGSYGRLYVPSGLAYGTSGTINTVKTVGTNANLLFRIKLLSTKGNRFASDTAAVVSYLNTIAGTLLADKRVLRRDPSGIRYWYDTLYAANLHPDLLTHSTMDVTYTSKVLNAAHAFDSATNITIDLAKQATAWKIILPKISQGSTVYMYVPSGYGYGSIANSINSTQTKVDANSNLMYQVTVNKVY